jgi:ABC-2 type transport system ATP-binding protein
MIRTQDLCKKFGDFTAVRGVNLDVQAGEIVALLGPNGAGKTTSVRMLASILKPTSGRAWVDGYDTVQEAVRVRHLVGVLTEMPGLYGRMKAREYLGFFGQLQGLNRRTWSQRSEQLMERFGMGDVWGLRLGEYSKGMRQKLALIRAMLHDPRVLLLDEPTSAMDPHSAKLVRDSILALRGDRRAIILCTHNLAEAEMLSDRIAIIRRGEIVVTGTVEELKRELLGSSLLEVRVVGSIDGLGRLIGDLVQVENQGEDWIRYRTDRVADINPLILDRLRNAGHKVITLSEVPRSLEEVYLQVIEKASSLEEVRILQ